VEKTLREKFCWNDERLALLQSGLWSAATFVESLAAAEGCRDPRDNHLLATSRAAQADMLVSGDKDVLVLAAYEGTRIVSLRSFANQLTAPKP
jgi:putative PIN family toxin of toxin-antitoxin system